MAVTSASHGETSGGSRWAIGANVIVSILVALALVGAINWFANLKFVRKDLASIDNYGISERTRRVLAEAPGEVNISLVYPPNPKDEKQQNYVERLLDYCDELRAASNKVKVEHIATAQQRERLAAEINRNLGGEAAEHKKALESFERVRTELSTELERLSAQGQTLLQQESWLSDFPLFTQVVLNFDNLRKELEESAEEIESLTPDVGISKFGEAVEKAKSTVETTTKTLESIGKLMSELTRLADDVAKAESSHIATLREVAAALAGDVASLRETIGPDNAPNPGDIKAVLKAYADRAVQVGAALDGLVAKIDAIAKALPIIRQHANWTARVQSGPLVMQLDVADVLQDVGENLRKVRLQLLGIIDTGDPRQLEEAFKFTRQTTARIEQNAGVCEQLLSQLAERLSNLDEPSRLMLESARDGGFMKAQSESVNAAKTELDALPELKHGAVADQLSEDNSIVVEVNDKIRVIEFDSVWPVHEGITGPNPDPNREEVRTFNGDSAISSAILALKAEKPFGAVTLVSFEPPAPQQRNPFMPPPPQSVVPVADLTEMRARLEAANFKLYEWNMATTPERPAIEEGLRDILVLLPPAPPAPPNPFGGQQPDEPKFGDEQRARIRELIDKGANAVFLGSWEVVAGGIMSGNRFQTPTYGYAPLLDEWGLRLDNATRVLMVEPDNRTPNGFFVNAGKFRFMPLTGFSDEHPISSPLIGTRFLVAECARILPDTEAPKGITHQVVARIPKREQYIGATVNEIIEIVERVNDPRHDGLVELGRPPMREDFNAMVTATRAAADDKPAGRIAVIAFGTSFRDSYVKSPILVDTERARFAPEPKESLDLMVNTVYWLNETEGYIGRGPVPVPRVRALSEAETRNTRLLVWLVAPAIALVPGILLLFVRRR